jgi:hypothetical protein
MAASLGALARLVFRDAECGFGLCGGCVSVRAASSGFA